MALTTPTATTLVVYTYDSLLGGGCGDQANRSAGSPYETVFGAFEQAHHVHLEIECPAGSLVSTLAAQAGAPAADVVLGLDEITGPQAVAQGLLAPYSPPTGSEVVPGVAAVLGGPGFLAPYEYGYLALDINDSFASHAGGAATNWSFPALAANASLASQLLIEDPTTDITGEEFLLWEIAFYQDVLHASWQPFWSAVDPHVQVQADWTDAYNAFLGGGAAPPMLVSYSLDPAANLYFGGGGYHASVGRWNGSAFGWETVYGGGVVRGSAHPALAAELVDWFQSGEAEAQLPLTEWEYPANGSVAWPSVFSAGVPPGSITPLDANGTAPWLDGIGQDLDSWQALADQAG